MKFTLKDYQADAVVDVLERLGKAARRAREDQELSSVALTATTGAGKTVMAAAVIEALFFGNDDLDVAADPKATVLWFTSDPSLNEQTRHRIMQASDRIGSNRLRVVESTFSEERLQPGTVYFLNSQKLSKNSLLVRGAGAGEDGEMLAAPDMRARTFWEVLANTIEHDGTTLYVILDEAHVGMKTSTRDAGEKATIVTTLVNGLADAPPVPIVLGISATIERYRAAMARAVGRTSLPDVVVDPVRVQESGLLKDSLILSFPAEVGAFDTVLLRHAVARTKEASGLWAAYHQAQGGTGTPVEPLLVVQVPNKPSAELLADAVATVLDEWPELTSDNIAHVFGEGAPIAAGGHEIVHVPAEDVAERTHIRVLLAKDAVSTGWDCPRAEVLVSFRPAQDLTHITQLLGRMVRTPLARRIPGDDRLNAVECILPLFNRAAAEQVARSINGGGDVPVGPSVVVAQAAFGPNDAVPEPVWEALERLPSQTVPRRGSRPVSRFTAYAAALAKDGVLPGAYETAMSALVAFLKGKAVQYEPDVAAQMADVLEMTGERIVVGLDVGMLAGSETFALGADDRAVEADYREARRVLTPQLAAAYADVLEETYGDGYFEAHLRTAALARVREVVEQLDVEADRLFAAWDAAHRVAIKALPDEKRAVYDDLRALAGQPVRVDIQRPGIRIEATEDLGRNVLATSPKHLLADESGEYPTGGLLSWEKAVLASELRHCVAWYRNPSRASADALAIAYRDDAGAWRRLCPDFVFFEAIQGEVRASIVDPHGLHLADALRKLRGMAAYAATYGDELHRIESVAEVDGTLKVLDFQRAEVREMVAGAGEAEEAFRSPLASVYLAG